tara:strand:+ start:149 stop:574 length:426 start_codon:yes stop_codon:yes gene_type:complete
MNLEEARRLTIQKQIGTELDIAPKTSGGWNVAGDMRSSPYTPFEPYDDGYDDIESYRGKPVFGVEEGGQTFFEFPFVQAPPRQNNMMIAHGEYFDDEGEPIEKAPYIFNRNTTELEVPWLKEDYYKDLPRRKKLHDKNYHT